MKERIERAKKHLKDNKKIYLIGAGGLVVGVVVGFVSSGKAIQIVDSFNIKYKSPTTNTVIAELVRRGHPGNLIRCVETGEVFASQQRAAEVLDVNPGNLSRHLNGKLASVNGKTFELIGEAQ